MADLSVASDALRQEYDDEAPVQIDEVHEALRGGHAFKKMPVEPGQRYYWGEVNNIWDENWA